MVHVFFWLVPLENSRDKRKFGKGSPIFPVGTFRMEIGKFRIPRRTWDEHDWEANAGQLLGKTNIDKLRLSRWKTIQIMKIIRFQSSNFTSTLKGYLFQTEKLWKELVELTDT